MDTIRIRSRAKLMRTVKAEGITIRVVRHWQPNLRDTVRKPLKIQTNGYWFQGITHDGREEKMWAGIPLAKDLAFNDDGSVTFYPQQAERQWTLAFESC